MNFDAFLAKLKADKYDVRDIDIRGYRYGYGYRDENPQTKPGIIVSWETGGVTGGSCWDSSNPTPYTSDEKEPEFIELDRILLEYWPDMSFLQYKTLVPNIVETGNYTAYEYYGNRTDYAYKSAHVKDIYDLLKNHGKL